MAMPRFDGSTSFITVPPMVSSPEVMSSSPAIIRRSVDFPQPEGPTKTTNSPASIFRSTPLMISSAPKLLRMSVRRTSAMGRVSVDREGDGLGVKAAALDGQRELAGLIARLDPEAGSATLQGMVRRSDDAARAFQNKRNRFFEERQQVAALVERTHDDTGCILLAAAQCRIIGNDVQRGRDRIGRHGDRL